MKSIEFNLLPKSRAEAMRLQAQQEEWLGKALSASLICFGLFVLLFVYANVVQKSQISATNKSITEKTQKLQQVPNINTILTVQNQLKTAATLNQNKHISSRIFPYLTKLTPNNSSVSNLVLDFTTNTVKIDGAADSANTVNAFIDALKSSQVTASGASSPAFTNVVESSFSINNSGVVYSLTANFEPNLFANNLTDSNGKPQAPTLTVPSGITGRSDPASVFNQGSH